MKTEKKRMTGIGWKCAFQVRKQSILHERKQTIVCWKVVGCRTLRIFQQPKQLRNFSDRPWRSIRGKLQHRPHPLLDKCILKVRLFTHLSRLYVIAIASCHVSQDVCSRSRHVPCDATRKVKGSGHKTSLA